MFKLNSRDKSFLFYNQKKNEQNGTRERETGREGEKERARDKKKQKQIKKKRKNMPTTTRGRILKDERNKVS